MDVLASLTLPWDDVPSTPAVPAVRVCQHGAAVVRLAAVQRHVREHLGGRVRVLAPTHEQAHDVARRVLSDLPATMGVERGGWVGFSVRLATPRLIARGLSPVSDLGRDAIVSRVIARAREEGVLRYFNDASRHPGFVTALARTLGDVRLAGVSATRLDDGTDKGRDLAWLLQTLEATYREFGYADRADVLACAIEAVQENGGAVDQPLALVDPPLTSRRDVELARALLTASRAALLTAPDGDLWAGHLRAALPAVEDVTDPRDHARTPSSLRRVQTGLFASLGAATAPAADDATDSDPESPAVDCLSAPGEGRECVEVVRTVLAHAERGVPFDRMAIVVRSPDLYASHLETALRRAGVPASFARGARRPDPAGRAFLALLACGAEGLSARRFAEYLSLGQVPLQPSAAADVAVDEEGAAAIGIATRVAGEEAAAHGAGDEAVPRRSPWRWERLLNDAQVIGGADRWERRLAGYREEVRLQAEAALRVDGPSSARHESLTRRLGWLDELMGFAREAVLPMAAWPGEDTWGGWLMRLEAFAPRVLAKPSRVLATLAELQPLSAVTSVSLADVCEVLRDRLTHLPSPPPPHRYGALFVGTPEQLRARAFDVVCVLGLAERVFPQRSRQDPLLLDRERAAVSPDLPTDDHRVAAERLQLRLAAGAATSSLLASYSSMEAAQARPRVPSFYAIDLQRAVTGHVAGFEALMRKAQQRSGARLAWPAPQDAAAAIDAVEHDLSVLQHYLRGSEADIAGRGRYLFTLNPAVRRALLARHARTGRVWTEYDGLVVDPARLDGHRLTARAYSASALQRYATCPYQFYLSTILRLEPREEAAPMTTLDPLTRGSMVHEMLAAIMRALIERSWVPMRVERLSEALALADGIVTETADAWLDSLVPPIRRVWDDAIAAIRRDIREWIRLLPEDQGDWTPVHVEMGLGFSGGFGRDEASRLEDVVLPNGARLHGVVDLIERRGEREYRITDYKTGKDRLTRDAVVDGGRTLQPVLYAMAVEAAFDGEVTASRLWYCTSAGGYHTHPWAIAGAMGAQARQHALGVLDTIDAAIASGRLPAAPQREACTWCDFSVVCGPDAQRRADRKDRRALAELEGLRKLR